MTTRAWLREGLQRLAERLWQRDHSLQGMIDRGELGLEPFKLQFDHEALQGQIDRGEARVDLRTGALQYSSAAEPILPPLPRDPLEAQYLWGTHGVTCRAILPAAPQHKAQFTPYEIQVDLDEVKQPAQLVDFTCACGVSFRMRWTAEDVLAVGDTRPGCYYGLNYEHRRRTAVMLDEQQIGQEKIPAMDGFGHSLEPGDCVELWDPQRNSGVLGYVRKVHDEYDAWGMQLIDVIGGDRAYYAQEQGHSWRKLDRGRSDASRAQTIRQAVESGELRATPPPTPFKDGDYVQLSSEGMKDNGALGRVEWVIGTCDDGQRMLSVQLVNGEKYERSSGALWERIKPTDPRAQLIHSILGDFVPHEVDDGYPDGDADETNDDVDDGDDDDDDEFAGVHNSQR